MTIQDQQDHVNDVAEQAELKVWVPAEYEAGRAARVGGVARFENETVCWRMGWQDADISLAQDAGDQDVLERFSLGRAPFSGWSLYTLGRIARANSLPFGADSPEAWKYGWIQMDIDLGVSDRRNLLELILFRGSA